MLLFESSWMENWITYERLFDTKSNKIVVRVVNVQPEYYVETHHENPRAHYKFILDQDRVFEKHTKKKKGASQEYGYMGAMYRNVRDSYWNIDVEQNKYHKNALYWCLDIETRSGVSYKNHGSGQLVKVRKKM